jgi:hypothetical protein
MDTVYVYVVTNLSFHKDGAEMDDVRVFWSLNDAEDYVHAKVLAEVHEYLREQVLQGVDRYRYFTPTGAFNDETIERDFETLCKECDEENSETDMWRNEWEINERVMQ